MNIGERLAKIREDYGYTRKRLAEELNRPYRTITNYENGAREPGHDYIIKIARKFGVSTDYILGLSNTPDQQEKKSPSDISEEAHKLARDYDGLDRHGQNVTRILITEEQKRMAEEKRRKEIREDNQRQTKVIPLYYTPAAAGMTSPAAGEDFDYIEVDSGTASWNADFAVKIDGDSMEPYIKDGSTVFVNREPLENGDVGIFYIDGDMICKQYYQDEYGNVHLLSLNRERRDADRFIRCGDNDTGLTCYGRVILPRRPPVNMA